MNFVPSWKALFGQLAATKPALKDFRGYTDLVKFGETNDHITQMLTCTPHCAILMICQDYKIKIIHHLSRSHETAPPLLAI
jgi:hypothetical protein